MESGNAWQELATCLPGETNALGQALSTMAPRLYISLPPTFVLEASKPNADIGVTNEELNEVAQEWIKRFEADRGRTVSDIRERSNATNEESGLSQD